MYDMHYDLLTILYFNLKKDNPKANIDKLKQDLKFLYKGNIKGGIINLYFMNENEMFEELGITKEEICNVFQMFKKSIEYLNIYQNLGIIPKDIDYIYGIEGCDFLQNENDLEALYKLGLRSIIPVWNNENKFGSGYKSQKGLTNLGVKLIEKAIELGIIIDLSHANEKTFYDIINVVKKNKNKRVDLIASHSNVRTLCKKERNLTDEQLKTLKECNGYIGLFTNGNFISSDNKSLNYSERLKDFMKHLNYVIKVIKFSPKKIIISTDDMNFHPDYNYHNLQTWPLSSLFKVLHFEISRQYGKQIANDILIDNAKNLIYKIRKF